jgi:hypothetical protein
MPADTDVPPNLIVQQEETQDSAAKEGGSDQGNQAMGEMITINIGGPMLTQDKTEEGSGPDLEAPTMDSEKKVGIKGRKTAIRGNWKGSVSAASVLGKRDARGQSGSAETGTEEVGTESDQNKKKKAAEMSEGKSNNGKDGGQEATGPGAPGLLVGATDSAHQEP